MSDHKEKEVKKQMTEAEKAEAMADVLKVNYDALVRVGFTDQQATLYTNSVLRHYLDKED